MASSMSTRNITTGLSPPSAATGGGNGVVNTTASTSSKQQQKGGGGMETGATDPVLLAVWGCGGIPCQASVHDRVSGKIHRQPIGGDDLGGGGGGGSDPSGASSCFVAVPRQGFLFAATKSIAEHFYPSGNGAIADSGPTTRLWYSVEVPQTVTFEPLPGPKGSTTGGGGGGRDRNAPGRLSIRLPAGAGGQQRGGAANQQHIVHVGGGRGGGGGGGGTGQTLKVSATTPFGVVLDELRTLLEDSVMGSPVFSSLPQNYKTNGIRAFVDLPIKIVLNVDDAPPSDLLTVGAMTYDRDASMMLRQSQKEATASMFAGSVAPLLMIEPSVLDNLKYAGSSKSLDPAPFLSVKREIISRGLAVLAKNHASSTNDYAVEAASNTNNTDVSEGGEGGISRQGTSIGIRQGSGNHDDGNGGEGGGGDATGDQHPLVIRFHIVTPVNMTVRDLTAEALAKAAGAAAASSSRPVVSQDGEDSGITTTLEMNLDTGLYESSSSPSESSPLSTSNYPTRLIGSMSRFLSAESTKPLDAAPSSPSSQHEVGMPPVPSTIVRRVLPSYTIGDLHVMDGNDGGGAGSPQLLPSSSTSYNNNSSIHSNVEIATRAQSLSRLGDVLRAFIVPFASLTDKEIAADSPLPPRFGSGTLTPPTTTHSAKVIGSASSASAGAGQPVTASSAVRPRVLVFGVEPSMCVPISALYSSMSAMDLALHITIDFTGCDNRYYIPDTMNNCNNSPTTKTFSTTTTSSSSLATWQHISSTRFTQHAQTLYSLHPSQQQSSSSTRGLDNVKGFVCECGPSTRHYGTTSTETTIATTTSHGSVLLSARDSTFLVCYAGGCGEQEGGAVTTTTTVTSSTNTSSSTCCWNPHCVFGLPLGSVNLPAYIGHQTTPLGGAATSSAASSPPQRGGGHHHLVVDGNEPKSATADDETAKDVDSGSNATESSVVVLDTATIPPPMYLPFVDGEGAIVRRLPMFVCVMPDARKAWIRYQHATSLAALAAKNQAAEARHASGGGGVMLPPRRHRSGGTTAAPLLAQQQRLADSTNHNDDDQNRRGSSEFVTV